jgi:hypothetical protein
MLTTLTGRQRGSILLYAILAIVILGILAGIGRSIYSAGAKAVRLEWEEANRIQREREAKQANEAATKVEVKSAKAKIVYRTITEQVDKYIDRPVYRNICFDADGLRDANTALLGTSAPPAKPDKPVPASRSAYRWEWSLSSAEDNRDR